MIKIINISLLLFFINSFFISNAVLQSNTDEIFNIPNDFKPVYKLSNIETCNFGVVQRRIAKIIIPDNISLNNLKINLRHAAKVVWEKDYPSAIVVYPLYGFQRVEDRGFKSLTFAPYGDWGRADESVPIAKYDFEYSDYFSFNNKYNYQYEGPLTIEQRRKIYIEIAVAQDRANIEAEIVYPMDPTQCLKSGDSFTITKTTPLMPEIDPINPLEALKKVKQLPKGCTINVSSVVTKIMGPWYSVHAVDPHGNSICNGWINSAALVGQCDTRAQLIKKAKLENIKSREYETKVINRNKITWDVSRDIIIEGVKKDWPAFTLKEVEDFLEKGHNEFYDASGGCWKLNKDNSAVYIPLTTPKTIELSESLKDQNINGGFKFNNIVLSKSKANNNQLTGNIINKSGIDYKYANFILIIYDIDKTELESIDFTISDIKYGDSKSIELLINTNYHSVSSFKCTFESGF